METTITTALLATESSLLTVVTPDLRAVMVEFDQAQQLLYLRFYFDGDVSEDFLELWRDAISDAGDRLGADILSDGELIRIDYPKPIPIQGVCAYLRKEDIINANIQKMQQKFKLLYPEEYLMANIRRALQNAVLGNITPNIREISVTYSDQITRFIYVHFYYHGETQKEDHENMKNIMDIFCKSFPDSYVYLRSFRIDAPHDLPSHQLLIYARWEKGYVNNFYRAPIK